MALSFESNVNMAWFRYSVMSDGGSGKELDDFLNGVREFQPTIPRGYVESPEYGVADILIAPFLVSFLSAYGDRISDALFEDPHLQAFEARGIPLDERKLGQGCAGCALGTRVRQA